MKIDNLIPSYKTFFSTILKNLKELDIDISAYPLSHLGFRTETLAEYETIKNGLLKHGYSYVEKKGY